MAITRTYAYPWRELDQMTNRLSRMFDGNGTAMANGAWTPAVSVEETENELLLTAELPGVMLESVDIQLENSVLTIRGTKEQEQEDQSRRFHVWERSWGSFERSFTLPRTVKGEDITAHFENGLLRVRMPKAPEARSRRIEITAQK
jgi:HSP20 family protein